VPDEAHDSPLRCVSVDPRQCGFVVTTSAGLTAFLTTPPPWRDPARAGVELVGSRGAVTMLLKAIEVFPLGREPASKSRPNARGDVHRRS
jgi:hypothetical protein